MILNQQIISLEPHHQYDFLLLQFYILLLFLRYEVLLFFLFGMICVICFLQAKINRVQM